MHFVLLVFLDPSDEEYNGYALVPSTLLEGVPLDAINNKILMISEMSDDTENAIMSLYHRLGIEDPDEVTSDLKQYVDKPMLAIPDRVVVFGWSAI